MGDAHSATPDKTPCHLPTCGRERGPSGAPPAPARVHVKAPLAGQAPSIASATVLWPAADWLEREVFDLFGIQFEGHPNLIRILLPDDWEGYPLRKDFPLTEEPVQFIDHVPREPSEIIPKTPPRA